MPVSPVPLALRVTAALFAAVPLSAQCIPCAYERSAVGSVVAGWLDQVRDDPKPWARNLGGLGLRVASRFGESVVSTSVILGASAVAHTDPRYHPCTCSNALARAAHAFVGPLTATTGTGAAVFSPIQPLGALTGGYTAMSWRPGPYDPVKGYQFALSELAISAGIDLVREIVR
jgi:hypothetical protein